MESGSVNGHRGPAVVSLVLANAILAISQANIASIYLPLSLDFHQTLYGLGLLTSVYFVGYGLFEIPGSILAAKVGPKSLVVAGGALNALSIAACAASPSFQLLVLFRTLAGVGYGLFFPPAIVIVIRKLGDRAAGLGASLNIIAFSIGGASGIFGWSVLSALAGWRPSLAVEFVITLGAMIAVSLIVPGEKLDPGFAIKLSHLKEIASEKATLALALSVFGGGAAANLTGSFLVYYFEQSFAMAPAEAGLLGTGTFVAPMFTSLLAGRLYDRGFSVKFLLGAASLAITLGTAVVAYPSVYAALVGSIVAGLAVGAGGTAAFSLARDLSSMREYESLNVSLVDAASLGGLFLSPLYFSAIATSYGYPLAWAVGGVTAVVFVVPLLLVKMAKRTTDPHPASAARQANRN